MKEKIIVITGPTATGKTRLSIEIAKALNGEIISADSMQIYKEADIGTAKPSKEEMQGIPHHLLDILELNESFSVAQYKKMADEVISDILSRKKCPIVVGGTGLYINSIIEEINYGEDGEENDIRKKLAKRAEMEGRDSLYKELQEKDYEASKRIHKNDLKRVIRALEVYETTGLTITEQQKKSKEIVKKYDYIIIGLNTLRPLLYDKINKRVDKMFEDGLLEEAEKVIGKLRVNAVAHQAIGYKELEKFFAGIETLEEAKDKIKQESRRYAKRQLTWFRRNKNITWLDSEDELESNKNRIIDLYKG